MTRGAALRADDPPDVAPFVAAVEGQADFFERDTPIVLARAPGRLDVMGGIADYSGSLVLELPLAVATLAAAQLASDGRLTVRTLALPADDAASEVTVALDALAPGGAPLDYEAARALLARDPRRRWAAYALGALVVLARERSLRLTRGVRLLLDSSVPSSKGVSSSAALEVASMQALAAAHGIALEGRELALLCQMVENQVVGAPCGVMDQMTAACGERDRLLALRCQPAELEGPVAIPSGLELWGIDSGIRHEVGGADYGAVRVGAFMGYRIIADIAGLTVMQISEGRVRIDDPRWHGYLANVTPDEWERELRDRVPPTMSGADFLARYAGTTDPVTRVDPSRTYAVRAPTAHPIHEHHRVRRFRTLLEGSARAESERTELGALMLRSHESYGACGLGSSGTDRLVELARGVGVPAGIYGAKITGGGSGGVVAVLARTGSRDIVERIAREYARETGRSTAVLGGSSSGAARVGARTIR
ncbi:MAG: GHMP kinase [Gemmatimonadaceae bacterium]|nr:GHMP kinase [Gemmatimonadaceae bacterium]